MSYESYNKNNTMLKIPSLITSFANYNLHVNTTSTNSIPIMSSINWTIFNTFIFTQNINNPDNNQSSHRHTAPHYNTLCKKNIATRHVRANLSLLRECTSSTSPISLTLTIYTIAVTFTRPSHKYTLFAAVATT